MSTQPVVEEIQAPVEAPKVFKARREIQPKDKDGNNLGSPHVYEAEGATQAEADQKVADKMADAISNGTIKIRELNLKVKNGGVTAQIPEGAEVEDYSIPEAKPRVLTTDERFQIANDFRDPAKQDDALDRLVEAKTGLKLMDLAKAQQQELLRSIKLAAVAEAEAFSKDHPEFYGCKLNKDAMLERMVSCNLKWTKKNLELVFQDLSTNGLLVERPKRVEPPSPPEPPRTEAQEEEEVVIEVPEVKAAPVRQPERFPSAIRPSVASGGDTKPKPKKPSAKEIAMMGAKEYKQYAEANGLWPGR